MVVWFSAAAIFFVWFSWRERQDQNRREQRWQEQEERKRETQRQRQQHLRERHALILRTRQLRYEQEQKALKLLERMFYDEKRITQEELDQLSDVICVETENLRMDVVHHENLYLGLSDEADKAIIEISDEEFALAEREEHREWERQQRMLQTSLSSPNVS